MASQLSTAHFGRALVGVCAVFSIVLWAIPGKAQTGPPGTAASVAPPSTSTSTRPVRVQILVDESVNVTDAQVRMEAAAADEIANAALAGEHAAPGEYQVAVSGFGSAPAEGRSAFDRVCPFREAATAPLRPARPPRLRRSRTAPRACTNGPPARGTTPTSPGRCASSARTWRTTLPSAPGGSWCCSPAGRRLSPTSSPMTIPAAPATGAGGL